MKNHATGTTGEQVVTAALQRQGFRILARNVRTRRGELDIIAAKQGEAYVFEVKTRRSAAFGGPEHAMDRQKMARMRLAYAEVVQKGQFPPARRTTFNLAAVLLQGNRAQITYYWNIGPDDLA